MKVILLAGGFGSRLNEYTDVVPKPMISIGGKPILWHIMKTFASFGHKEFYIALGYKAELIKQYFLHYRALNADFTVDLATGAVTPRQTDAIDWRVTLIDTGLHSMTGGRVKRLQSLIGNETCLLTYGDGVSDIDLDELVSFHRSHGRLATITAVRPAARFGELELNEEVVTRFQEKPQMHDGWINGGYMVLEPGFFGLIDGDSTILEREPLETAAATDQLRAYRHSGFWQCMDTKRDRDALEELWAGEAAPWKR
jgi:glucose-1-phosphate cytidylyltransferase